jgi:hypothetical protein
MSSKNKRHIHTLGSTEPIGVPCVCLSAMQTNHLILGALVLFGAATLRAQTPQSGSVSDPYPAFPPPSSPPAAPVSPVPPASPPAAPVSPYGWGPNGAYSTQTRLAGAVSVPYAFNWNAVGISAELGGLWMQHHFFGGEVSYYDGDSERYSVYSNGAYIGHFNSSQQITTLDFAYRYFAPLGGFGPRAPFTFYIGGSGGVGFVHYTNSGSAFGFRNDGNGNGDFSAEGVAGFQFNASPFTTFRLGYRYVIVNDAWRYDRHVNLESNVLEAGFTFRF